MSVILLVAAAIVCCHANCPEGESEPPRILHDFGSEAVLGDAKPAEQPPKLISQSKNKDCGCSKNTESSADASPKIEEVVVEKFGKKYRVTTVTVPIIPPADIARSTSDQVVVSTEKAPVEPTLSQVVYSESTTETPVEETTTSDPTSENDFGDVYASSEGSESLEASEDGTLGDRKQEKPKKEKAKVEKKKYKRDVTSKKSAGKKTSKRKNKEQGKRKSKK